MIQILETEHPVLFIVFCALLFESNSIFFLIFHFLFIRTAATGLTSRHLLHEDLYEAVLADGSEVLDDVLVL